MGSTSSSRIQRSREPLIFVFLRKRCFPLIRNILILIKVRKEVDNKSMHLVQFIVVRTLHRFYSISMVAELQKNVPLSASLRGYRIVLINKLAKLAVDLANYVLQLFNSLTCHNRDPINYNNRVDAIRLSWSLLHDIRHKVFIGDIINEAFRIRKVRFNTIVKLFDI